MLKIFRFSKNYYLFNQKIFFNCSLKIEKLKFKIPQIQRQVERPTSPVLQNVTGKAISGTKKDVGTANIKLYLSFF